jgi:hypothetical protein
MVIRIHEIIQREKPAHTHYYLEFSEPEDDTQLREFFAIGLRSGIGIGDEVVALTEDPDARPEPEPEPPAASRKRRKSPAKATKKAAAGDDKKDSKDGKDKKK